MPGVEVIGVKKEPLQQVPQSWILIPEQNILEQSRGQEGFSGEKPKKELSRLQKGQDAECS